MPSALRCFCTKGERLKLAPPCFSCLLLHKTAYFCLYNLAYRYFQQIPVKETLSAVGGGDRPVSCLLSLWTEAIHALQFCLILNLIHNFVYRKHTQGKQDKEQTRRLSGSWSSVYISLFLRACLHVLMLMSKTWVRKDCLFRKRYDSNTVNLLRMLLRLGMFRTGSLLSGSTAVSWNFKRGLVCQADLDGFGSVY